jgi:homeobox protein cut-like
LLEKNRQLQSENTQTKNKLNELNIQFDIISKEHSEFKQTNTQLNALVVELEKDLLRIARTSNSDTQLNEKNIMNQLIFESNTTLLDLDKSSDFIKTSATNLIDEKSSTVSNYNDNQQLNNNDISLFNIVSNQRERFRIRCQELETESMASKQQVLFLTNELDHLRSDNIKLYEKIRFLQSVKTFYYYN